MSPEKLQDWNEISGPIIDSVESVPPSALIAQQPTSPDPDIGDMGDSDPSPTKPQLIGKITEEYRTRMDFLRAEIGLGQRSLAICRRWIKETMPTDTAADLAKLKKAASELLGKVRKAYAGKDTDELRVLEIASLVAPFLSSEADLKGHRMKQEKEIRKMAGQLPIMRWLDTFPGMSALGLGILVAETGDLAGYSCPSKVWKRLGLGVIAGERQRKVAGKSEDAISLAILHGYCPWRRSITYVASEGMVKTGIRRQKDDKGKAVPGGEVRYLNRFGELYDKRRVVEATSLDDNGEHRSPIHQHKRAMRYAFKRFLVELWAVWRWLDDGKDRRDAMSADLELPERG